MVSRKVSSGLIGVNVNFRKTGVLLQTTEEADRARVVMTAAEAVSLAHALLELAAIVDPSAILGGKRK